MGGGIVFWNQIMKKNCDYYGNCFAQFDFRQATTVLSEQHELA